METEMELQWRIAEEGFEIAFNLPGDGNCCYWAAAIQLGFKSEILLNLIFDHLKGHQFDESYWIAVLAIAWRKRMDCLHHRQ